MGDRVYFGPVRNVKIAGTTSRKFKNRRQCYICQEKFDYQIEYRYTGKKKKHSNYRHVVFTNSDASNHLTQDHVIPKVLIKKYKLTGIPNLTEPCCQKCNNNKSKNEVQIYFRTVDKIFSNWE